MSDKGQEPDGEKYENLNSRFLSKQFANFFSSYTQAFNKVYKRRGSLFLKNFKRKEIRNENYLRNLILYIHLNPVHHGFTEKAFMWKFSSYASFPVKQPNLLASLFDDRNNYHDVHQSKESDFKEYEKLEHELT